MALKIRRDIKNFFKNQTRRLFWPRSSIYVIKSPIQLVRQSLSAAYSTERAELAKVRLKRPDLLCGPFLSLNICTRTTVHTWLFPTSFYTLDTVDTGTNVSYLHVLCAYYKIYMYCRRSQTEIKNIFFYIIYSMFFIYIHNYNKHDNYM